jgi:hypothetical protein
MGDFLCIGTLPSIEEIKTNINTKYDDLFSYSDDGKYRSAVVCTFCDEILFCSQEVCYLSFTELEVNKDTVAWTNHYKNSDRNTVLEDKFTFQGSVDKLTDLHLLDGLALSPRGRIGQKKKHGRSPWGFSSCNTCKNCIKNGQTPLYAIVNQNTVGHPPKVLTELTAVELALVTPVKGYGYCFSYVGGAQMNLKGTMTFMRVQEEQVAAAAAQLNGMGLANTVVILLTGNMTPEQKASAQREVRVQKILDAVTWLTTYNKNWMGIDFVKLMSDFEKCKPTIVDRSTTVGSENANVESHEIFSCYYPDGGMDRHRGGFDDHESFKVFVDEMQKKNYDLHLQMDLARSFVQGNDGEQLTRACLLQFPYGVGGMNEKRLLPSNESFTTSVDHEAYLQHLTKLSQPIFQEPMFQLVAFTIISKMKLLRQSRLQVRGEFTAKALANGLNHQDLMNAVRARQQGQRGAGTVAAKELLKSVDACSKALPHTNEAAKQARSTGEAMQHHFGIGSVWLTFTPDDENSLLMQVLSDSIIDDDANLSTLSAEELSDRRDRRRDLRLKLPGYTAVHFEVLLHIMVEEVIGWNMRTNKSTGKPGLFGVCKALAIAFEEQGRKSIHAHITIFVEGVRRLQKDVFFGTKLARRDAMATLVKYHEHVIGTKFFDGSRRDMQNAFDHDGCTVQDRRLRSLPEVVCDQDLRNLRHKQGYIQSGGLFAFCQHCGFKWTYEQMVDKYTRDKSDIEDTYVEKQQGQKFHSEEVASNIPKARMLAEIIQYQKSTASVGDERTKMFINGVYNHHLSCHAKGCFKCNKKEKKHVCGPKCECRMRYPDRARVATALKYHDDGKPWFTWNGEELVQPIVEFLPKRNTYDLFQNTSCRAISESKLACNTNAAIITDGPIGQYQFKYQHKKTQKDDVADYENVERSMKKLAGDRKHDDDRKEAVRRICRAAFAHNSTNIIGAPMASFLVRNGSRFYFSHSFVYCPLSDLTRLLRGGEVSSVARFERTGDFFFENQALHYLCRPAFLEKLSPKLFFEQYKTARGTVKKRKRNEQDLRYINTAHFQHTSSRELKNKTLSKPSQGATVREESAYIKVPQWMFPDTGKFKANIFTCPDEFLCPAMEKYAEIVLTLLMPYRCLEDFEPKMLYTGTSFPFVQKFREVAQNDASRGAMNQPKLVFTDSNTNFLQNIQDAGYNSMRYKIGEDDLQCNTTPFQPEDSIPLNNPDSDTDEEEKEDGNTLDYEYLLQHLDSTHPTDKDITYLGQTLQNFSLDAIRNKGSNRCGYLDDVDCPPLNRGHGRGPPSSDFIVHDATYVLSSVVTTPLLLQQTVRYKMVDVVELLMSRGQPRARPNVFDYNPLAKVSDANGSLDSIFEWAEAAKLDLLQRRAFEIVLCAFLLTFFDTSVDDANVSQAVRRNHRHYRQILLKIADVHDGQLILLLLGPGGSGKTTVINLVVCYAREYCDLLGHPFNHRTIVVSAMTGVAATWLHGETTHKAVGTNRDSIPSDMMAEWWDTRLLIVDEVSFASPQDINAIKKNCGVLKKKPFLPYGKCNIVFSGDFSQLPPVKTMPLYKGPPCPAFHNDINSFIELNGHHRFRDDPEWGHVMSRFREGQPTPDDIDLINDRCLVSDQHKPPSAVQAATFLNANRDAYNSSVFERFCETHKPADGSLFKHATLVFMDNIEIRDTAKTFVNVKSNSVLKWFYSNCGENACKIPDKAAGRVDPCLKLYCNCPLMLTLNADVMSGQANGSRVFLEKIHMKVGERPFLLKLQDGCSIRAYFASQVQHVSVRHEKEDILPNVFNITAENWSFKVEMEDDYHKNIVHMKGCQFPVISNSATTGHKLQGYTALFLLVLSWTYHVNWAYTVLSRVRTMAGLFMMQPLSRCLKKYEMPREMKNMLAAFRTRLPMRTFTRDEYETMRQQSSSAAIPTGTTRAP